MIRKTYGQSELSVFDEKTALMYSGDDPQMFARFGEDYLAQKEATVKKLTDAYAAADWKNYTIYAHGLKSSSLSLGGKKLSETAKAIEQAGKNWNAAQDDDEKAAAINYIKAHHEDMMRFYDEFSAVLSQKIADRV